MDAFGGSEVASLLHAALESLFFLLYQLKARIKCISIIIEIVSQRKICALFLDCTRQNFASLNCWQFLDAELNMFSYAVLKLLLLLRVNSNGLK